MNIPDLEVHSWMAIQSSCNRSRNLKKTKMLLYIENLGLGNTHLRDNGCKQKLKHPNFQIAPANQITTNLEKKVPDINI